MGKTFFAVHDFEIVPCHRVPPKDRVDGMPFRANGTRDKRSFAKAYPTLQQAERRVRLYENKINNL